MQNKIPVIFDMDPGIDDAMAFLMAVNSNKLDILLVTTVCGNLDIKQTTRNALHLCELFGFDGSVAEGVKKPLKIQPCYATKAQGLTGLGGYQFADPLKKKIVNKAHVAIHKTLLKNKDKKITLLCTGAMTNIATWLLNYPEDKKYVEQIVFMGGSKDENELSVPYREFNVAFDPQAMQVVIDSKIPLLMVPMDLGHIAYLTLEDIEKLRQMNYMGEIFEKMFSKYNDFHVGKLGAAVHDSVSVVYLTNPELFKTENVKIKIDYYKTKQKEYGYINCNFNSKRPNCKICIDMNIQKFKKVVFDSFKHYNNKQKPY